MSIISCKEIFGTIRRYWKCENSEHIKYNCSSGASLN